MSFSLVGSKIRSNYYWLKVFAEYLSEMVLHMAGVISDKILKSCWRSLIDRLPGELIKVMLCA